MNEHKQGQVAATAAEIYEQFFVPALFVDWPVRLLEVAGVHPGHHVLDVACGTGILARKAENVVGDQGSVTGLDINEGMLNVARTKSKGITWTKGRAESLPFKSRSFDRVLSQFGLMFFDDPGKSISEMLRVTRTGGVVGIAVWDTLEATPGYSAVAELLEELFGREVAESIKVPYSLGDVTALKSLLAEAGVHGAGIKTVQGKARFDSIESWVYTDIRGWTLADVIDDDEYERLRLAAQGKLSQFIQPDGTVAFDAPAHIIIVQV